MEELGNKLDEKLIENDVCIICMSDFCNEDLKMDLPVCEHEYHWYCIEQWLKVKPSCPYCRAAIRVNLLKDLRLKGSDWSLSQEKKNEKN